MQGYSNDARDHVLMTPLFLKNRELSARMYYWSSKTHKWNLRNIAAWWKVLIIMHQSFSLIIWLFKKLYQHSILTVIGWSVGSIYDALSSPVVERGLISRTVLVMEPKRSAETSKLGRASVLNPLLGVWSSRKHCTSFLILSPCRWTAWNPGQRKQ